MSQNPTKTNKNPRYSYQLNFPFQSIYKRAIWGAPFMYLDSLVFTFVKKSKLKSCFIPMRRSHLIQC